MRQRKSNTSGRLLWTTAFLFVLPMLAGAKDDGCALGGQLSVGSGPEGGRSCAPEDCAGLAADADAKLCADGTAVSRTVCAALPSGTCGWDFPACPSGGDSVPPACPLASCAGKPVREDAKLCPDGTSLGRTSCAPSSSGVCDWDFPPCPSSGGSDGAVGSPVHACPTGLPLPAEPCFTCDPLPPGSSGGCGSVPKPFGWDGGTPNSSRYPQGCIVYLPVENPFYPGGPQSCNCEEFPGQGLTWICPT